MLVLPLPTIAGVAQRGGTRPAVLLAMLPVLPLNPVNPRFAGYRGPCWFAILAPRPIPVPADANPWSGFAGLLWWAYHIGWMEIRQETGAKAKPSEVPA